MCGLEAGGELHGDAQRPGDRQRAVPQDFVQRRPFEQLERHEEVAVAALPEVVEHDHVRVAQPADDQRLAPEAVEQQIALGGAAEEFAAQHLDGDPPPDGELQRPIDDAHPAPGDDRLETEPTRDERADVGIAGGAGTPGLVEIEGVAATDADRAGVDGGDGVAFGAAEVVHGAGG
jgi:hypothetical protein